MKKASDIFGYKPRAPLCDSSTSATCGRLVEKMNDENDILKISRDSEDMLIKVKRKPHLTLTKLYNELGYSGDKSFKSKQELIRNGLVTEVELPAFRRGRKSKLLEVTVKGNQYLKSLGVRSRSKGRGGVKHIFYQKLLKKWYVTRGYTVEIEATVGNTCLDVLAIEKDSGSRIGVEIALSEQYELINAEKALKSGVERFLIVCETEAMIERLRRKIDVLAESLLGVKPEYRLLSHYVEREKKKKRYKRVQKQNENSRPGYEIQ